MYRFSSRHMNSDTVSKYTELSFVTLCG